MLSPQYSEAWKKVCSSRNYHIRTLGTECGHLFLSLAFEHLSNSKTCWSRKITSVFMESWSYRIHHNHYDLTVSDPWNSRGHNLDYMTVSPHHKVPLWIGYSLADSILRSKMIFNMHFESMYRNWNIKLHNWVTLLNFTLWIIGFLRGSLMAEQRKIILKFKVPLWALSFM